MLSSPREILETVKTMILSVVHVLLFSGENIAESIFAWLAVAGVPAIMVLSEKAEGCYSYVKKQPVLAFFLLNGILTLFILTLSH